MSYTIEMLWECSVCGNSGNSGLKDRYCCNCGKKKQEHDREYMPDDTSEAAALGGEDDLKARAGLDRICKYCDSVQNKRNKHCGNCGADDMGPRQVRLDTDAPTAEDVEPPKAPSPAPRARKRWTPPVEDVPEAAPVVRWPWRRIGLIAAAVLAFAWLLMWLFMPRQVRAEVAALSWKHDTVIERYQVYHREGWYPSSGAFEVMPMGLRHHHYDHVLVGSHQEPYQERYACGQDCYTTPTSRNCTRNGNGTATCTTSGGNRVCSTRYCSRTAYRRVNDYQDVSRSQMWFGWNVWDWGYNRTVTRSGATHTTVWPSEADLRPARLGDGEQERSARQAQYKVVFKTRDGDEYSVEPKSDWDFQRYDVGDTRNLKVTRAGSVEVLGD